MARTGALGESIKPRARRVRPATRSGTAFLALGRLASGGRFASARRRDDVSNGEQDLGSAGAGDGHEIRHRHAQDGREIEHCTERRVPLAALELGVVPVRDPTGRDLLLCETLQPPRPAKIRSESAKKIAEVHRRP